MNSIRLIEVILCVEMVLIRFKSNSLLTVMTIILFVIEERINAKTGGKCRRKLDTYISVYVCVCWVNKIKGFFNLIMLSNEITYCKFQEKKT